MTVASGGIADGEKAWRRTKGEADRVTAQLLDRACDRNRVRDNARGERRA
jgi:hypothetical protein